MIETQTVVAWLRDLDQTTISVAGGKGANLGELRHANVPVPPGFVVTTAAYDAFVAHNNLRAQIIALATQPEDTTPDAYEKIAAQIHNVFMAGDMPAELAEPIHAAYACLTEVNDAPVAVRSSATAEDLPGASFAGQQETFLNVRGAYALLHAVMQCWASLWTARAMAYRARQAIAPDAVSLAVVVQQMVDAEAAGILFTANPANGRRDETVIDAAWGLGEAIVGGEVTPDQWIVDTQSGQVLAREIADKAVMKVYTPRGTAEQPVPDDKRRQPAIAEATALALTRYGTQIAQHFGMPMDIEWAVANGEIAILQARPITALPEPTADAPTAWPLPFEGAWFVRGSITEQMPDPLSPLFATLAPEQMSKSIRSLFQMLADNIPVDVMGFTTINNYVYIFMKLDAEMARFLVRAMGALGPLFRQGTTVWRDEFRPRYRASIATWQATPPQDLRATDLLAGTRELLYRGTELYTGVQMVIPLAIMSEVGFTEYYNRLIKRPNDPPAQMFLLGFESQPIRADKALYDLALWSRDQLALAGVLAETPSSQALNLLNTDQPPDGVADGVWQQFRARFHDYLDQFGHAIYNLDFLYAVPADDPTPLFETLKFYMQGQGSSPYQRQQDAVTKREQATRTMLARLDPARGAIFRRMLAWAQDVAPVREDALAAVGLGWPLLRQLLLELGRRLAEAGAIERHEDIFWLEQDAVTHAAAALDAGQTRLDPYADIVAQRRMTWRGQKRATPPQMLPENGMLQWVEAFLPAGSADQTGPVIKGVAVGSGTVTATARVLHGPEDFSQLKPGDVLVAGITTPAWTPLFALASAVVTDVGGPLSHGSIVAREYGIPAVLGTGIATRRIQSGQSIRVDGDAGTVTLLDEVDADAIEAAEVQAGSRVGKFVVGALALVGLVLWWRKRR